jgi:Ecdysteroid kinase-like family
MTPHTDNVVERPADLTAAWLTTAIGAGDITDFTVERIGTGQMSECYRVQLSYADTVPRSDRPDSVVLKVAATDPMSRQTGMTLGLYEREVSFYRDLAARLQGPVSSCYHTGFDASSGIFDVLLEDANPAVVGDEIRGATTAQAQIAVTELARLQGPLLGDATLADASWLNRDAPINQALIAALHTGFVDRYGDQIAPQHRMVCERLVGGFDGYLAEEAAADRIHGLVHGDYRLDNMLFGVDGAARPLTVVDWQTVTWAPAMTDLAYFLGCALPVEDRREHYDSLLEDYHRALGPDAPITLAEVRGGVRRQSFFGVMMAIVSSMLVERTERGDAMFMTMLQRHCEHVLDTNALDILPAPASIEPLCPSSDDESAHPATDEQLWNESWYADFADTAQGFGGWLRLGLIPNQQTAWLHALLCGPGLPTVAVVDFEVPLPADPWAVHTDAFDFTHSAEEPLRTYHMTLRGRGKSYQDPAALLRAEPGTPAEVQIDLTWTTDGTPYQYRIATRYEIPCTVTGSVTIDGRRYTFDSVPGQRDHSWGVRDWWSMDWIWSALHLDDGTHLHAVGITIAGIPPVSIGYIQDRGETVTELQTIAPVQTFDADGLPVGATLAIEPGGITATADVRGHAPLRLVAQDGRVSQFPRVWATVTTADGRGGVGWLEWNRNQPAQ